MTDNHFSYRNTYDVRDALEELGAKHKFIKPHCPWQNGKVCEYRRAALHWSGLTPAKV